MTYRREPRDIYRKRSPRSRRFKHGHLGAGNRGRQPKILTPPSTNQALFNLSSQLSKNGIGHMAAGAIPVNYYGRPRFSEDLDVAIILDEGQEEALFKIIKRSRYSILYPNREINRDDPHLRSPEDLKKINLVKMRDTATGTLIDLLIGASAYGLAPESFSRARRVKLEGRSISIASPEDYILMKMVSRRPATEDFSDMFTTMVNNLQTLDWAYLEKRGRELDISALLTEYRERAKIVVGRGFTPES